MSRGPVLVELGGPARPALPPRGPQPDAPQSDAPQPEARVEAPSAAPSPADAPPIDDGPTGLPQPRTMELVTRLAGRVENARAAA